MYLAKECCMSKGVGVSEKALPSFDRALLDAGVGNYNLVRLSSILPTEPKWVPIEEITDHIREGSLLPTAYSTISSRQVGQRIVSSIGVGIPKDKTKVGVIMEFSTTDMTENDALKTLHEMIEEAFEVRGWELEDIKSTAISAVVEKEGSQVTTFACISEW